MKKLGIIILVVLLLCGCKKEKPEYITLMEQNDYVILDVRTKEEYQEEHLKNAENIPYDEIDETITISKDKMIFVYCRSGSRSQIASETLKALGYNVYDMGGINSIDLPKE